MTAELVAPISVDLRTEDLRMDIIKGMEDVQSHLKDEVLATSLQGDDLVEAGDWLVLTDGTNVLDEPSSTGVANTFPVWVGNDQFDAQATGQATIILCGDFIYRTTKYVAGTYHNGDALTVKDLGGGERVPSAAGGGDAILCRVYKSPDTKGVMEIMVLSR